MVCGETENNPQENNPQAKPSSNANKMVRHAYKSKNCEGEGGKFSFSLSCLLLIALTPLFPQDTD